LLVAAALIHNGAMTCWRRQSTGSSSLTLLWLAACSIAALTTVYPVPGVRAEDVVTIEVVGEIQPKCRLSALPVGIELGEIPASGTRLIPFQIDCNTPFEFSVRSRDGALKNPEASGNSIGFVNHIPYMLEIRVPTDEGLILDQCDSASLSGASPSCGHGNSGFATAIDQTASLKISWAVSAVLIAGTYSDVLTVTFQPRL
jgi:hypothetical protein